MKQKLFVAAAVAVLFAQSPAYAQSSIEQKILEMEKRIQSLEGRVSDQTQKLKERDKQIENLKKAQSAPAAVAAASSDPKWTDRITIYGGVSLDGSYSDPYSGNSSSDFVVSEAVLGVTAQVHDYVGAEVSLLYEEDDTPLEIDLAVLTVADPEGPWTVTGGQHYVPFGVYETGLISDPLTLEVGEARETALDIALEASGFSVHGFIFNGTNNRSGDDQLSNFGAQAGYEFGDEGRGIAVSAGYINDIGDSDGLQDVISDNLGGNDVKDHIPGLTASLTGRFAGFQLFGEYISATESFQSNEVSFGTVGAQPSAWTAEVGYGFQTLGKESMVAASYQGSDEALALGIPKRRYLVGYSIDVVEHVGLALEWAYDDDYDTSVGGTGKSANTITAQVNLSF